MLTTVFTIFNVLITWILACCWNIGWIESVALWLGIEGTIWMGSAFSVHFWELNLANKYKGVRWILWWFTKENKGTSTTVSFNPVLLYVGIDS